MSKRLFRRRQWPAYREASEDIFKYCSVAKPWQIIPADQNCYRDYLIAKAVVERMENLHMNYPESIGE